MMMEILSKVYIPALTGDKSYSTLNFEALLLESRH